VKRDRLSAIASFLMCLALLLLFISLAGYVVLVMSLDEENGRLVLYSIGGAA
jgi:hypothetical protein